MKSGRRAPAPDIDGGIERSADDLEVKRQVNHGCAALVH
jgi:hypothetical protein